MSDLRSRNVLLTGASKGIGRAIALRLAREGVRLALAGRDEVALRTVADEARAQGAESVHSRAFDLKSEPDIIRFAAEAKAALGPPDIVINNAGFNSRKAPIWEVGTAEFDDILSVNLRAPFILIRETVRDMIPAGKGHVVSILSSASLFANETMGAYTAAKKGLQGLTEVLLKELRPHGIRVSAIYPGGTDTSFRAKPRPDYMKPESVAECVHAVLSMPDDLVVHGITFRPMVEGNF